MGRALVETDGKPAAAGKPDGLLRIEARQRRGAALRLRRRQLALTQVELARAARCVISQISMVERGRAGVSETVVQRIERALAEGEARCPARVPAQAGCLTRPSDR